MAPVARFKLDESEAQMVDGLCAEYDPEQFIPPWMRERESEADWQAYLRVERFELRGALEGAMLLGPISITSPTRGLARWLISTGTNGDQTSRDCSTPRL